LIRLATEDDLPQLWPLLRDYMESQVDIGASDQTHVLEWCLRFGVARGEAVVVAEDDGVIVGFCLWVHNEGTADDEVAALGTYVVPTHRKRNLSGQMREMAKEHCRLRGYKRVAGAVLYGNEPGLMSALASGARLAGTLLRWDL
jgi:GNAT superfamily N-acetyltransferase